MRLRHVQIFEAQTCGGLLDDLNVPLHSESTHQVAFEPLCLVGPNGAGKSQFLQVVAEMFQSALHACVPNEERNESNAGLLFEVEYSIRPNPRSKPVHVKISRTARGRRRPSLVIERRKGSTWVSCPLDSAETQSLLPAKIVGYTSGDNETLSLPFLVSRSGYADDVARRALHAPTDHEPVPDTRLMLVDYGTHLEVLVANLLLGSAPERNALLGDARLRDLHSFRCIIQLAHGAAPRNPTSRKAGARKGVQLTSELEQFIDQLKRCATCHDYDPKEERLTLDFWLDTATRQAFKAFWSTAIELYGAFHKLSMLNDLAIPKSSRERFRHATKTRHFASRLPEPLDEDKVFRFEEVRFTGSAPGAPLDYVSLSDGEHQLAQLLGTMCMVSFRNVLFLLDEPESHFNPRWRVKFISRLMDLPTADGQRALGGARAAAQDCLLTTHAPFVPSDMPRERVLIFSKKEDGRLDVRRPDVETFGTTFDTILEACFGVRPPMSDVPRKEIERLMDSGDAAEIAGAVARLGHSVEKVFLIDHLSQVKKKKLRKRGAGGK